MIRSCAIFRWYNPLDSFFLVRVSGSVALAGIYWSIHILEGISAKPPLTQRQIVHINNNKGKLLLLAQNTIFTYLLPICFFHISVFFPLPHATATTFLLFCLHRHHYHHISIVFPLSPTPSHFYYFLSTDATTSFLLLPSTVTTTFLLFSRQHKVDRLYRRSEKASKKPIRANKGQTS